ncbi:hypothetical protein PVK06_002137 [Gossypium arboreum]|uniref:Uncharacterized protein n=1 Tax=Gossypium arboreum TaxID=29729 RepID=A0ABR0R2U3_GOSAR|nr:hypothetical protein PVK06_002137 [Gossypium arboreum]
MCSRISPLQAVCASGWDLAIWKIYTDPTSCGFSRRCVLQVGYLDCKNGLATSQLDGGGHVFVEDVKDEMVGNCQMTRSMNVEIYSRRLETFRVTETLGPMELISKINSAIAGGSKYFIIQVHMSWQRVLKSRSMLNNFSMMCTHSSTRCMSGRMSSPSCLTCLCGRCLRRLSSFPQTKGCVGIREFVSNHPESIMKWTLGRNPMVSIVDYAK